ncbi:MAG: rhodanese-like domain-containing protein [Pseudomonadota bacterium]
MNGVLLSLSPREALEKLRGNAAIVDIRPEYEISFRSFDVPKVFYIPYELFYENTGIIPRDILVIIADSVGNKSSEAARHLISQGYSQVACLSGGMVAWDRAGMPLSKDEGYAMSGGCACRLKTQKDRPGM